MTKMTDAFKKLFLGLGGDSKELAENNDVGDYIEDLEGAIKAYVDEAAGEGKELPTPAAADIGKVVSVVSDGESGAEYSLETPSGGGEISREIGVTKAGDAALSVTFLSGAQTRDQIIASVNMADFKIDSSTISAFIWYNNTDFSVMFGGDVFLTGVIQINNVYLPVYSGVILNMSGAGGTNTQGDLYQVIFILRATAAEDLLEVIKLTTT